MKDKDTPNPNFTPDDAMEQARRITEQQFSFLAEDHIETIRTNPRSWIAWKGEAERLQSALTEALDRAQRAEAQPSWDKIIADLRSVVEQSSKIAELEKDAARYRWLREQQTINDSEWCVISQTAPMCVPRDLDAAIDLASSGQGATERPKR